MITRNIDRAHRIDSQVTFLGGNFAAMIPGDSAVETVITSGLFSTLNIYNTLLIGRLILTWFPNPPRQLVYPLSTLCDPYLNLFRGIIPPIGEEEAQPRVYTRTAVYSYFVRLCDCFAYVLF